MLTDNQVREALKQVKYPGFTRDIVSFGIVKQIAVTGGDVAVTLQLTTGDPKIGGQIRADAEQVWRRRMLPGVGRASVENQHSGTRRPLPVTSGSRSGACRA